MEINIKEVDGVNVVEFTGNLDTNTAPEAENQINNLLASGAAKILVNFENLNYISSAGLRVLLATASAGSIRYLRIQHYLVSGSE